ncbi:DUF3488 domain-containing transglutaminase family protein [Thalassotalea sp. LPB0316]|uniref:transglutaminase family protein n=1 Tax=Thalassotalea sp. LPB0316 TaxID=2769490 RepID=UPI00186618C1|nr:DUF3488 and transglutaminase-like domain-containing protein [Thalassotalea sp. LPB0316]QOL25385.1 DUF3488 domain-containing transglutaminase family protein [Thalassotalea sp. LPB0316]
MTKSSQKTKQRFALAVEMQGLLLVIVLANLLVLASQLSPWFVVINVSLIAIYYLGISRPRLRARRLVFGFTITGALILIALSQQLGLMLTMVNLLAFSHVMKLFEQNHPRDFYTFNLLSLVILATAMIFHQSLWYFLLFLVLLVLNLLPLVFYDKYQRGNQQQSPISLLKLRQFSPLLGKALLLSMPLAICLFFIFPRLQPFAAIPQAKIAKTGLSEQVSVGDISQLVQSNELAFQVEFSGSSTVNFPLYWRALVMEYFDGVTWQGAEHSPKLSGIFASKQQYLAYLASQTQPVDFQGESLTYQVYVQPSYQPYLFALDVAKSRSSNVTKLADQTLIADKPVSQKLAYQVQSYPELTIDRQLPELSRAVNLMLPDNSNPRLQNYADSLVAQFRQQQNAERLIIDTVLADIRNKAYFYTLNPPLISGDRLDQFFFDTKAGFCVHYASAFTFIMRSAGIPARLVTGYLGGEYHEQGRFYSIRQKDAHAWSEVWLEELGWTRVDPTAAVSPERIEQGIDAALVQEQALFNTGLFGRLGWLDGATLLRIRGAFELVDYQWTKYIVGFSQQRQSSLLQQLFGQGQQWKVALTVALVMASVFVGYFVLSQFHWRKPRVPTHVRCFHRLQAHFANSQSNQVFQHSHATVREYCRQLADKQPSSKNLLTEFYILFEAIDYQAISDIEVKQKKAQLLRVLKQITEQS